MNFEKIAIMLAWILFTCFVAFMGTFYIQREMAKGPQLANNQTSQTSIIFDGQRRLRFLSQCFFL